MKRLYLKIGDKSSAGGTVIEGIPFITDNGREVTFVGATVSCPACKATGPIVAKGPRWPTDFFGKGVALEGDICKCKCCPHPVMIATDPIGMNMMFDGEGLASLGFSSTGAPLNAAPAGQQWIRFTVNESGDCAGLQCRAYFLDGSTEEGIFDSENQVYFEQGSASACQRVEVLIDGQRDHDESLTGKFLRAMGV